MQADFGPFRRACIAPPVHDKTRHALCGSAGLKEQCFANMIGNTPAAGALYLYPHKWSEMMDWNRVEGNWKQFKGKVKEQWGDLTDDDLDKIDGKRENLEGRIQERYGLARDKVRQDVDNWFSRMPPD